jgi:hypothetical protein
MEIQVKPVNKKLFTDSKGFTVSLASERAQSGLA